MTQAERRKVYQVLGVFADDEAKKRPPIRLVDGDKAYAVMKKTSLFFGNRSPQFIEGRDSHIEVGRDWLARAMAQ